MEILRFILKVWVFTAFALIVPAIGGLFLLHRNLPTFLEPDVIAGFRYIFQAVGLL